MLCDVVKFDLRFDVNWSICSDDCRSHRVVRAGVWWGDVLTCRVCMKVSRKNRSRSPRTTVMIWCIRSSTLSKKAGCGNKVCHLFYLRHSVRVIVLSVCHICAGGSLLFAAICDDIGKHSA